MFVSAIFEFLPLRKAVAGSIELKTSIHIHIGECVPAFLPLRAPFVEIVLFEEPTRLVLGRLGIE